MSRTSWDETFIEMCRILARRSTCWKRQTAAILVDSAHRVLSMGYNGVAAGRPHCCEVPEARGWEAHRAWSLENEHHAEQNALTFYLGPRPLPPGCILYTLMAPCLNCARAIETAGISQVIYEVIYDLEGLDYLRGKCTLTIYNKSE